MCPVSLLAWSCTVLCFLQLLKAERQGKMQRGERGGCSERTGDGLGHRGLQRGLPEARESTCETHPKNQKPE